jgi:type II secretory pathway pseudopilin PulG
MMPVSLGRARYRAEALRSNATKGTKDLHVARRSETGMSLVGLMIAVAIMSVALMVSLPGWKYVIQDDREQELLFRGNEIARAIERYQAKNNGAMPVSLDVLVKGKFLRRRYKDPFSKDGNWKRIAPGQMVGGPGSATDRQGLGRTTLSASPLPGMGVGTKTREFGPIAGVGTNQKGESLRLFNGRNHYEEWTFVAGQPRIVGSGAGGIGPMPPTIPGAKQPPGTTPQPRTND